jgi:hypothetical protein
MKLPHQIDSIGHRAAHRAAALAALGHSKRRAPVAPSMNCWPPERFWCTCSQGEQVCCNTGQTCSDNSGAGPCMCI